VNGLRLSKKLQGFRVNFGLAQRFVLGFVGRVYG
jgi:hypothetical protein